MQWFKKLTVGSKLIGGFLTVAAIGALIGVNGIQKSSQINDLAQLMYEREIAGMLHATEANISLIAAGRSMRSAVLSATEQERARHLQSVTRRLTLAQSELESSTQYFVSDAGKALARDAGTALRAYASGLDQVAVLLQGEELNSTRASIDKMQAVRPLADQADDLLGQLVERKRGDAKALNQETDAIYGHIRVLLITLTAGGVLVGLFVGIALTRSLTRSLGGEPADVAQAANAIAAGNLSLPIDTSRAGAGSVVAAMHGMQRSLREVVGTVREASDSIATGASQIAVGNTDLSQRTEEQASNLEETDASRQAADLARTASAAAQDGGRVVGQVVTTMQEINASSQRISDIIGVIDGIAFQTNILALNAAVEAARAGEQGRGFAVVAGEVRSLAQKSALAAKEIKGLIHDSVGRVEKGSQLVNDAGQVMGTLVTQVRSVADLIGEITSATQEQTAGIGQINEAVIQLDTVTQQNAALVEEAAAAADSLNHQAQQLVQAVAVFDLGDGAPRAAATSGHTVPAAPLRTAAALPRTQQREASQPAVGAGSGRVALAADAWKQF
ncbi:methyl-accepting chemotaxis protein [Acidovorax sp. NPDC077693]|uniref:methyl-accepting chemotaxis protein n=1 Tax=unclassified Acidovorax TaxID=2684926 RepID=UPI0037CB9816